MCSLAALPQEIIEHIAFFTGTSSLVGPPSDLVPLLLVNHRFHAILALDTNPHLWARIHACKFDIAAAVRRLGVEDTNSIATAREFRRRWEVMHWVRHGDGALTDSADINGEQQSLVSSVLWTAYLMMLENDGNNVTQLREYARLDDWLKTYLLAPMGASLIRRSVSLDRWPSGDACISLAMWLFWLLLRPNELMEDETASREIMGVLKLIALGAHQYVLCKPSWQDFIPTRGLPDVASVPYFGLQLRLSPPAPAPPAILSYLSLVNKLPVLWDTISYMKPADPTVPSQVPCGSEEWEAEWARSLDLARMGKAGEVLAVSNAFPPGSLEGSWEGLFTYTEFTAYAALLSGASPSVLERSLVAQHPQLWKLREYHLYAPSEDDEKSAFTENVRALAAGDPLHTYIPSGTEVRECHEGLEVREPGKPTVIYESWALARKRGSKRRLRDVIITGEGHSAWGQFNLLGRIRPCDGLISLSKDYMNGDRGRWLYRCYMVGNLHGNLSGRWRDTLSPSNLPGYEGCFLMTRRQ